MVLRKIILYDTNLEDIYLGGVKVSNPINDYGLDWNDLNLYFPFMNKDFLNFKLEYKFLGYYLKRDPQEVYYYATNCGFESILREQKEHIQNMLV